MVECLRGGGQLLAIDVGRAAINDGRGGGIKSERRLRENGEREREANRVVGLRMASPRG